MKRTIKYLNHPLRLAAVVILMAVAGSPLRAETVMTWEPGYDRPGGDYSDFDLAAPNPALCKAACESVQICAAYTYVHPGVQGPNARCWLKNTIPARVPSGCCASGVRVTYTTPGDFQVEPFKNRPGMDYSSFGMTGFSAKDCLKACRNDPACRAFTYVAPGFQGPVARCWLKNGVPGAVNDQCCVSGVKVP